METAFFPWSDKYSVGVKEIDEQHKRIVGMLNDLYNSFMRKEQAVMTGEIIQKMIEYSLVHFKTEEKYFKKFGYSDEAKHIEEHKGFVEKVGSFKTEYQKNPSALTFRVIKFLKDWLNEHILGSDSKYSACFKSNGLS